MEQANIRAALEAKRDEPLGGINIREDIRIETLFPNDKRNGDIPSQGAGHPCQLRLKIAQSFGRKIPSPGRAESTERLGCGAALS